MSNPEAFALRLAIPADCELLTRLAVRSKGHWGYPEAWMEEWLPQLRIDPEYVLRNTVVVAESHGDVVGFHSLDKFGDGLEIGHMWVDPDALGGGVGRFLFEDACERARNRGFLTLRILSDPNAEGFYTKMGAVRVGMEQAPVCGESRELPVMEMRL